MRLNWFSPLPPAKTGVAQYTKHLLPHLARRAEVVVWTDQDEWDAGPESHAEVRHYRPEQISWPELNRADATFYHVGNNALFHGNIWLVSRRHPGVVVLHDSRLQHFFGGLYVERWRDPEGYVARMSEVYGEEGRRAAEALSRRECETEHLAEKFPLTPLALENALAALVHTKDAFDALKRDARRAVAYAPLPYAARPRSRMPRGGRKARRPAPPFRLIVFGHLGRNRRLGALLEALAQLRERERFRLDVYGPLWDQKEVSSHVRALGLGGLVTLHGYVAETELDEALARADLAVNLRYPTMGEASMTQLQIWEHALPSLVTQADGYRKSPAGTVAFVRPGREIADLKKHLRAFLADPRRFAAMGAKGRRALEERHAPQSYARAVTALAAEVAGLQLRSVAFDLAARVGSELGTWIEPSVAGRTYRRAAEGIRALFGDAEG
jgi:glycosyltransferase involved in cell wall biosynthesis